MNACMHMNVCMYVCMQMNVCKYVGDFSKCLCTQSALMNPPQQLSSAFLSVRLWLVVGGQKKQYLCDPIIFLL